MRRLMPALLALALTCAASGGVTKPASPVVVSYCDLASKPQRYHKKVVRVRGVLYARPGSLLFRDPFCRFPQEAVVTFHPAYRAAPAVQRWVDDLRGFRAAEELKLAEATLTGRFVWQSKLGCFAPRYRIEVEGLVPESAAFGQ